jgi:hypothetical protein
VVGLIRPQWWDEGRVGVDDAGRGVGGMHPERFCPGVLNTRSRIPCEYPLPPEESPVAKISVEVPDELLSDLDEHVGDDKKFVNRSDAIRASIRKTLDLLDEIDERHGRIGDE